MKRISVTLAIFVWVLGFNFTAEAISISKDKIQAFGTIGYAGSDPSNTLDGYIDDNINHYWVGTDNLAIGDTNWLAYKFDNNYRISQIDFWSLPWHYPQYFMGELEIQISHNSTDGEDGVWATVDHIYGDYAPNSSPFSRSIDIQSTPWVRLWMQYQDQGAWGASPAFYLNEIEFHGGVAPVPEPATILLVGLGLAGLAGIRRKFI
ncbi:hypothetical protein D3OALGB2SA_2879 [Olavius algarvensis associated proteobacterium Delta 3]|nr:hypothetical protein D3OALGB2SA_2879 [Olavius algarvensis associated proteobacterium Delta 3]